MMKRRKLLSILLSICVILAFMPQMVFAEEKTGTSLTNDNVSDGTLHLEEGQSYYLSGDIEITKMINISGPRAVTLDLNGHVIKMTGGGIVINVQGDGDLILQDSRPEASHTGDFESLPAGGVITGAGTSSGVYNQSFFTMNGGTIFDCSSFSSEWGGVYNSGTFTMTGGAISNCDSHDSGGGVYNIQHFTMNGGTISNCDSQYSGGGVYNQSIFTMNGGTISDCSAGPGAGDGARNEKDAQLYANGGTIIGEVVSEGKIQSADEADGCTEFYGSVDNGGTISYGIFYGGISGSGTVNDTYHTVSFNLNGGSGSIPKQWFVNIDTAHALEPADPTKEGYEFTGWYTDEALNNLYNFNMPVDDELILYAGWDEEIITLTVPFTTTVELGGNVQPGETVFNMQVLDLNGDKYSSGNVEIEAKPVTTNGAGSYNGKITFTGTESEIFNMFRYNGSVFVKQADVDDPNWTDDDKVWCLFHYDVAELSEDEVDSSPISVVPAKLVPSSDDGTGYHYEIDDEADDEKRMTFTNRYTAYHYHKYIQEHNDTHHWDKCSCGYKKDEEEHQYGDWKVTKEATETEEGEQERICKVCNYTQTEIISMLEHTHNYIQKYDETYHWDECGCRDVQNKEEHQYGKWTVTKKATQTAKGEKVHTCTVCGYQETAEIAKLSGKDTTKPDTDTSKTDTDTTKHGTDSVKTGDDSNLILWFALLAVSAAGVIGSGVYGKRKRSLREK